MAKINKKKFLKALENTAGILSQIANHLDVSRQAVYDYIDRTPEIEPAIKHEKERILDVLETSMIKKAQKGDFKAGKFYLKTIGKHRGFTEKSEVEVKSTNLNLNKEAMTEDFEKEISDHFGE